MLAKSLWVRFARISTFKKSPGFRTWNWNRYFPFPDLHRRWEEGETFSTFYLVVAAAVDLAAPVHVWLKGD